MRSLVVCPYLADAADHGGRIRTRVFLAALARLGPVDVGAPFPPVQGDERAAQLANELGGEVWELPGAPGEPSVLGKLSSWVRGRSELFGRRWAAGAAAAVEARLRAGRYDLLAVDSSHSLPLLPLLPRAGVPSLLMHFHNIESALLSRRDGVARSASDRLARSVESRLVARLEARAATAARLSITTSALDAERLRALAPGANVEAVPNSVDLPALPLLPPCEGQPPRLLFVGALDYPPNRDAVETLLREHLPVLRAACPELQVRLVGHDQSGELSALARQNGLEVTGRVDDLLPHYRESTAVYLPIRGGGGTRIKVVEAFALGRPVLSTRVGVEGLDVRAGEHYLEVERPEDGVAALAAVRRGEAADLVRRARQLAEERYGHDVAMDRMAALVRDQIDRRP